MFEKKTERILPFNLFARRMPGFVLVGLALMSAALGVGVAGDHWIAGMALVDAIFNASMILTGMGSASDLPSTAPSCLPLHMPFSAGWSL